LDAYPYDYLTAQCARWESSRLTYAQRTRRAPLDFTVAHTIGAHSPDRFTRASASDAEKPCFPHSADGRDTLLRAG